MQGSTRERVWWLLFLLFLGFPVIWLRLLYMQGFKHEVYLDEANKIENRALDINPRRGKICDRNGEFLAIPATRYEIQIKLKYLLDGNDQVPLSPSMQNIARLFDTPVEAIHEACIAQNIIVQEIIKEKIEESIAKGEKRSKARRNVRNDYLHRGYTLDGYEDIGKGMALVIECGKHMMTESSTLKKPTEDRYRGFFIHTAVHRRYPKQDHAAHILGTMKKISAEEYNDPRNDYLITDITGRSGLESRLEHMLCGLRGELVRDRRTFVRKHIEDPTDGANIFLTIDSETQKLAETALDEMIEKTPTAVGGAAVALDIHSGEILVMATSPRYDNNKYSELYRQLTEESRRPLENRAIYNAYPPPPGSTFKIVTGIAALEEGLIAPNTTFVCRGYMYRRGAFRCTHVHGRVDLAQAIAQSCNIYFYHVGEMLGAERLHKWGKAFGFGLRTKIAVDGEQPGFLPEARLKGEQRMLGIGQLVTATPLQVAVAMAIVATQGQPPRPHLIREYASAEPGVDHFPGANPRLVPVALRESPVVVKPFTPSSVQLPPVTVSDRSMYWVKRGMYGVVHGDSGTAKNIRKLLKGLEIASKTGTSQVRGKPDHAWFAGFAPIDNPQYAFAVFVEHGGYGGQAAAPVAAKILTQLLPNH